MRSVARYLSMRRIVLAMFFASASHAAAQGTCTPDVLSSLPAGDAAWCAADKAPSLVMQTMIAYPNILLSANVEGEVVLEATIDTTGRIDVQTLTVRRETHELFTRAAQTSMRQWLFVPARIAGNRVRARGVLRIDFLLPRGDSIPREAVVGPARATSTGLDATVGWRALPYDPPANVDSMRVYSLIAAIARRHQAPDTLHACLAWQQANGRGEPPAALIDYLRNRGTTRLPLSRCPPTYRSMIAQVDSLGQRILPPPGAVDPQILTISELRPWTKDVFAFRYALGVGTGAQVARCQARWVGADEWQITCGEVRFIVS